jgi:hypothetical protein
LAAFAMVAAAAGCALQASAAATGNSRSVFYVSISGDDRARGTSPAHAWRTIARANGARLAPGSRILFEGGQSFTGSLFFDRSDRGTPAKPILVGSYGKGLATIVGTSSGIVVRDMSGIRIDRLRIRGAKGADGSGIDFVNDLPGNVKLPFVRISRVDVSGFGQWGVLVEGTRGNSGFSDVRITHVLAHDNVMGGIGTQGVFNNGYSHDQVYVGHSEAYDNPGVPHDSRHTGDGIMLSDLDGGMVERSIAHGNGRLAGAGHGGPVGIWTWDANRVVIQHNESYENQSRGKDGGGFDLDGGVRNSVLQDNYSHDNHGPGYLALQFANAVKYGRRFENDTIRRNVSVHDARGYGDGAIWIASGAIEQLSVYGNRVLVAKRTDSPVAAVALSPVNQPGVRPTTTGVDIRDNVLGATGGAQVLSVSGRHSELRISGNSYFSNGEPLAISWNGKTYRTLAAWRAVTKQEQGGSRDTGEVADAQTTFAALGKTLASQAGANVSRSAAPSTSSGDDRHGLVLWASIAALLGLAGMAFAWQRRRHAPRKGASGAGTGQAPREEQARIKRRLRGYDPRTVDRLVRETANLHRQLTNEKEELTERVATLERELEQYRAAESSLAGALVYSEKVAAERQEQARQEAEELIQAAQEERARLQAEIERLEARRDELITSYRAFVLVALELLEEHDTGQETPAEPSPLR